MDFKHTIFSCLISVLALTGCATSTPMQDSETIPIQKTLELVVDLTSDLLPADDVYHALYNIEGEIELISDFDITVIAMPDIKTPANTRRCIIRFTGFFDANFRAYAIGNTSVPEGDCNITLIAGVAGIASFQDLKYFMRHEIIHALIGGYHNTSNPQSVMTPLMTYGQYYYFTQQDREAIGNVIFSED